MAGPRDAGRCSSRWIAVAMLAALGAAIPAGTEDDDHASLAGVRATDKSAEALLAAGSSICRFLSSDQGVNYTLQPSGTAPFTATGR